MPAADPCILLTGANGFVGRHLVVGLTRTFPHGRIVRVGGHNIVGEADVCIEITNAEETAEAIARFKPDVVVHLAGIAAVKDATANPTVACTVNVLGTANLVAAVQRQAPSCHFIFVSSGEVYGASFAQGVALDETAPVKPLSYYAATKAAAEMFVMQAARAGLPATIVRPFNHTGPGQSTAFAIPAFAAQIASIERSPQAPVIRVGNLDSCRDFLDVDDVVRAYVAIVERRSALADGAILNVASGRAHRIGDLLDRMLALSKTSISVEVERDRLRVESIPIALGSSAYARSALDWEPKVGLDAMLARVLEYARAQAPAAPGAP